MKKIALGVAALMVLLPVISFAQTTPQAPASWVAFQRAENAKRSAFFKEMNDDRTAFLNANPDVKTYLDQMRAEAKTRFEAWKAAHPRPNNKI